MSMYFDVGDKTRWNPSNGAGRLFLRQVESSRRSSSRPRESAGASIGATRTRLRSIRPRRRSSHAAWSPGTAGRGTPCSSRSTRASWPSLPFLPLARPNGDVLSAAALNSCPPATGCQCLLAPLRS
ncbi:DUF6086 family protein [Streptomyces avermitilis]|uniref:DUF6086 family protein n=1 Tax=Streptomyces avermitilis TaxID=33903 RepID=UPI0033E05680